MIFGKWKKQESINKQIVISLDSFDNKLHNSFAGVKSDVAHVKKWINYLHNHQDKISSHMHGFDSRMDDFSNKMEVFDSRISDLLTKDEIKRFVDEYYQYADMLRNDVSRTKSELNSHLSKLYSNQRDLFKELEILSLKTKQSVKDEVSEKFGLLKDQIEISVDEKISKTSEKFAEKQTIFDKLEAFNRRIDEIYSNVGTMQQAPNQTLQEKSSSRQKLREKIFKKVTRHSKEYVRSMLVSLVKKYGKISGLNLREIVVEEQGLVSKSSFYRLLIEIEEEDAIHVIQEGKEKHYVWAMNNTPISE